MLHVLPRDLITNILYYLNVSDTGTLVNAYTVDKMQPKKIIKSLCSVVFTP